MIDILDRTFERVLWRDGDLLTATDLQSELERDQTLRCLHVSLLHNTWGIAMGFDVRPLGSSQVAVGAGYAVDQQGRDLILASGMVLDIPVTSQPTIFVLCAAAITSVQPTDALNGSAMNGLDHRMERPAFVWHTSHDAPFTDGVPLVAVRAANGALIGSPDQSVRRSAHRLARPYIVAGMTDFGGADWEREVFPLPELVRRVDTTDAGFSTVPVYFARLARKASKDADVVANPQDLVASEQGYIVKTDRTSFEYRVPITNELEYEAARGSWAIAWEGIEPLPHCAPTWSAMRFFTLAGLRFSTIALGAHG